MVEDNAKATSCQYLSTMLGWGMAELRSHTMGDMCRPRKGGGTLHLYHLSICAITGRSLELSQLRDARLKGKGAWICRYLRCLAVQLSPCLFYVSRGVAGARWFVKCGGIPFCDNPDKRNGVAESGSHTC